MKRKFAFLWLLTLFFLCFPLQMVRSSELWSGSGTPPGFIESDLIRKQISSEWFEEEISRVLPKKPASYTDRYANVFTVAGSIDRTNGFFSVSVVPDRADGVQGTWILTRRLSDGQPDHIIIYPLSDDQVFVTLRPIGSSPEQGRTSVSITVYGADVCRNVPAGNSLVRLYTRPFSSVMEITGKTIPWNILHPDWAMFDDSMAAVHTIRERLHTLVYYDDGAFDENGRPVFIKDGSPQNLEIVRNFAEDWQSRDKIIGGVNCSGFAKWVIDGIIKPSAGAGLYINPLKSQTASPDTFFTEPFREIRDLFFGLDWTRNLAAAVVSLSLGRTVLPDSSGADITVSVLAGRPGYFKNVGYEMQDLLPLLYWLAVHEPGHLYLGAVSRERGEPPMRQFHHVAVFFPHFDKNGTFSVVVFENAEETDINRFIRVNSDAFINLVRVKIPEDGFFDP
ncbi:hypothetical protein K7I13_04510 [Brucepastera parasyntrophica]|uniref:hypothetical protein n=1 Tax=Brucepastera parasyntrophica TaxID=2880008 RepID=UPI00210E6F65|nr:hypothetical protein [Brucepastera parasyntrophica]ULQ60558.1 hypothetical protein K7I13_04510 [Brucepastera parasyntrophica]